jgi:hypothetical protein
VSSQVAYVDFLGEHLVLVGSGLNGARPRAPTSCSRPVRPALLASGELLPGSERTRCSSSCSTGPGRAPPGRLPEVSRPRRDAPCSPDRCGELRRASSEILPVGAASSDGNPSEMLPTDVVSSTSARPDRRTMIRFFSFFLKKFQIFMLIFHTYFSQKILQNLFKSFVHKCYSSFCSVFCIIVFLFFINIFTSFSHIFLDFFLPFIS